MELPFVMRGEEKGSGVIISGPRGSVVTLHTPRNARSFRGINRRSYQRTARRRPCPNLPERSRLSCLSNAPSKKQINDSRPALSQPSEQKSICTYESSCFRGFTSIGLASFRRNTRVETEHSRPLFLPLFLFRPLFLSPSFGLRMPNQVLLYFFMNEYPPLTYHTPNRLLGAPR